MSLKREYILSSLKWSCFFTISSFLVSFTFLEVLILGILFNPKLDLNSFESLNSILVGINLCFLIYFWFRLSLELNLVKPIKLSKMVIGLIYLITCNFIFSKLISNNGELYIQPDSKIRIEEIEEERFANPSNSLKELAFFIKSRLNLL